MYVDRCSNRPFESGGEDRMPPADRPSIRDYAMLEELSFVRREAQAEAEVAYEGWRVQPTRDGYAVYLAAQDRADAAQDQLASWAKRVVFAGAEA